jgi:hypothetical protein
VRARRPDAVRSARQGARRPAGPFTATLAAASNLSVGSVGVVIFFSLAHLTTSAPFQAGPPGPVFGRLSRDDRLEQAAIYPGFPSRFRCRPFASWSSDSRRGIRLSSRSAYRTRPEARPDLDGVTAFRTHELQPGWVPFMTPRTAVLIPAGGRARPAPAALPRLVLRPRSRVPSCGAPSYEALTRVQAIHPSGLPLARGRPDGAGHRKHGGGGRAGR